MIIAVYCSNFGHCFLSSSFGALAITYGLYLGLIEKRVVEFLLVLPLIELFFAMVTADEDLRVKR